MQQITSFGSQLDFSREISFSVSRAVKHELSRGNGKVSILSSSHQLLKEMSVSSLTSVQIRDAQEAFRLFDRDSDGKIHASVLGQTLRSLALSPTNAVRFLLLI